MFFLKNAKKGYLSTECYFENGSKNNWTFLQYLRYSFFSPLVLHADRSISLFREFLYMNPSLMRDNVLKRNREVVSQTIPLIHNTFRRLLMSNYPYPQAMIQSTLNNDPHTTLPELFGEWDSYTVQPTLDVLWQRSVNSCIVLHCISTS